MFSNKPIYLSLKKTFVKNLNENYGGFRFEMPMNSDVIDFT